MYILRLHNLCQQVLVVLHPENQKQGYAVPVHSTPGVWLICSAQGLAWLLATQAHQRGATQPLALPLLLVAFELKAGSLANRLSTFAMTPEIALLSGLLTWVEALHANPDRMGFVAPKLIPLASQVANLLQIWAWQTPHYIHYTCVSLQHSPTKI